MKRLATFRWLPLLAAMAATGAAQAQEERGRVISSTPIVQAVPVPRKICTDEEIITSSPKSGAGALLGAIAGGAAGNAIGNGSGRAAATAIGLIGGAVLGNRIEGESAPRSEIVRSCGTQTVYENRAVAYDVVYEYAGRQYRTQMAQDPGPSVRLNVTPVDALPPPPAYAPSSRPQVRYEAAPTRIESYTTVVPTYPLQGGVVVIGGQRYHPAPGWRPSPPRPHGNHRDGRDVNRWQPPDY